MFEMLPMNCGPDVATEDTVRKSPPLAPSKGTAQKTNKACMISKLP